MSARVCLIIAFAWLALSAQAEGQFARGMEPESWQTQSAVSGEQPSGPPLVNSTLSNAPRAVSYADQVEATSSQAGDSRALGQRRSVQDPPMPLPPRSQRPSREPSAATGNASGRAMVTVISSLVIVLAVFFVFVWLTRSAAPKGMAPLSKDVVESLGRAPLLGRQQMQLIRIGNKLILLSVTASGADTLTEITDPVEVDRLCGLCRQSQAGSISDTFRQVLAQASSDPGGPRVSHPVQTPRAGLREARRA